MEVMESKDPQLVSVSSATQRIFGNLLEIEKQLFSAVPSSTGGVSQDKNGSASVSDSESEGSRLRIPASTIVSKSF